MGVFGFDRAVPADGYRWWYVDALSEDGACALTVIFFIGSVFSPYYAWARRRGPADPVRHCACNVALYGVRGPGWAMTERGAGALAQGADGVRIGPSRIDWRDGALVLSVAEWTAPVPRRVLGTITLTPAFLFDRVYRLDAVGRHGWAPIAPSARVSVDFARPAWRWRGTGYADTNWGSAPLERDFTHWAWSRAGLGDGSAVVLYDAARRDGGQTELAARFHPDGRCEALAMPPRRALPAGRWGVARHTHGDGAARVLRGFEDAPFYTRSLIATELGGEAVTAVHESLSLDRFARRWVQVLLPFRMPIGRA